MDRRDERSDYSLHACMLQNNVDDACGPGPTHHTDPETNHGYIDPWMPGQTAHA